ncbi:MAG TPA: S9 family peptidase [bacterium]
MHILMMILAITAAGGDQGSPVAPVAKRTPKVDTLFGDIRTDDYYWLRDRDDPAVRAYLEAENAYAQQVMAPTESLQEALFQEMVGRIQETDQSVPEKFGDCFYYTRTVEDKQYPLYCRKQGSLDAREEIILDQNTMAAGHAYFDLGVVRPSPNNAMIAYTVDTTGNEQYTMYIKDLTGDSLIHDQLPEIEYNVEWALDDRTIFYMTCDQTYRPYRLYRHQILSHGKDRLLYQEDDAMFYMDIKITRSRQFLLMTLGSKTTTEIRCLSTDLPQGYLKTIVPRRHGIECYVEHQGKFFYIMTNDQAPNFKIMRTPITGSSAPWSEMVPASDSIFIEAINAFQNFVVVSERIQGLPQLLVINVKTGSRHYIKFNEPAYACWVNRNPEYHTSVVRYTYSSFVTPTTVIDYDMTDQTSTVKKEDLIRGYDRSLYITERILARAPDGKGIPIVMVYKKGSRGNGPSPLVLEGYGAYGSSEDPYFSSAQLSLLDRGFICALAAVRGGGEMGRQWYEHGKILNKKNTFTDFIACAEHLIDSGYTSRRQLVIEGGSAGGLLIGAVLNMRPDLFFQAVAQVPFVDVLNTMLDPSIPLTVTEYEEWGDPHIEKNYFYIRSYSPYDNVSAQAYPHMLVTASLNDPRVGYWEPAKWVARLRAQKSGTNLLLFKTNMGAGHSGVSGRYERFRERAYEFAFIISLMKIR